MIRVVLDTNVWVSGLLTPEGSPGRILKAWDEDRFDVIVSEPLLEEIGHVLLYPHIQKRTRFTVDQVKQILLDIYEASIPTPGKVRVKAIPVDPPDEHLFVAAVEGEADYIVSGDKRVLKVKRYRRVRVISPADFLKRVKGPTW